MKKTYFEPEGVDIHVYIDRRYYMYTYIHAYIHTYIPTCLQTDIHAYTYTHIHTHRTYFGLFGAPGVRFPRIHDSLDESEAAAAEGLQGAWAVLRKLPLSQWTEPPRQKLTLCTSLWGGVVT